MGHKKRKRKERELAKSLTKAFQEEGSFNSNKAPLWQYIIPPAIISVLTVIFYAPSMRYDFQFDDIANIKKFFYIRHYGISKLFFKANFRI